MKNKKSSPWGGLLKWLPGILISAVIIYFLSRLINVDDLKNSLTSFRPETLIIIIILVILSIAARSMAWRVMIGEKAKFQDSFFAVSVGYMLNNIIPRSGEIGKAVLMGASTKYGTLHVLSTVVVERSLDLAIAASMFLSTLPLALQMEWLKPVAIISLLLVIVALVVLFVMANNRQTVHRWITKKGEKSPLIQKYVLPGLDSLLNGFSILTKPGHFLLSLFWIGLCWTLWALLYFLAIRTFIPQAPFWWAIFAEAVLAMGIALPSAPAGLGVFEGALVGALSFLVVGQQSNFLGMALVLHVIQIVITFILGGIGMLRQGWTLKKLLAQVNIKQS
jgi:glycosyltransferase 2 family protein